MLYEDSLLDEAELFVQFEGGSVRRNDRIELKDFEAQDLLPKA